MEETEQERRDEEVLVTIQDYINLLGSLKEVTSLNQQYIKDSIKYVSGGLLDKVQYVVDLSTPYRKKRWFAWFHDWRVRRRNKKEAEELEKQDAEGVTFDELRNEIADRDQKLLAYEQEIKDIHNILEAHNLLALLAPPKEPEVSEETHSDNDHDGVMNF